MLYSSSFGYLSEAKKRRCSVRCASPGSPGGSLSQPARTCLGTHTCGRAGLRVVFTALVRLQDKTMHCGRVLSVGSEAGRRCHTGLVRR